MTGRESKRDQEGSGGGMSRNRGKCDVCGVPTYGWTGHCRPHKFAIRRAAKRVREESLIIDRAGNGWWVWDAKGEVLVIGQDSKAKALALLDLGVLDFETEEDL